MAPAHELAALYSERWELESPLGRAQDSPAGPRVVLRSRTSDGVYQEEWGKLCVHYAIRALLYQAAHDSDIDPDRVSLTRTREPNAAATVGPWATRSAWPPGYSMPPTKSSRNCYHVAASAPGQIVRRTMTIFAVKRPEHRHWPQPTLPTPAAIRILSPP